MEDKNDYAKSLESLRKCNPEFNHREKLESALAEAEQFYTELKGRPRELSIARCILVQFRNTLAFGLDMELWPLPDIVPEDNSGT